MVIGVCNGFQVLVESGLLPGFNGISDNPEAVLAINADSRFQCRPSYLIHHGNSNVTDNIPKGKVMQIPIAHAEGRLSFGGQTEQKLKLLKDNGQIVFTYCDPFGNDIAGKFPLNPNGSVADIAGICDPTGNIMGMMPHPERVLDPWQHADWTRKDYDVGDGLCFFESIAKKVSDRLL